MDKLARWLAWKLPRPVVRWAFYRVLAHATSGFWSNEDAVALSWQDAADRWEAS